jgi:hypothetical protein
MNRPTLPFRIKKLGIFRSINASISSGQDENGVCRCNADWRKCPMKGAISLLLLLFIVLFALCIRAIQAPNAAPEPDHFFREYIGLSKKQIRDLRNGKAVAKIMDSPAADQVFVFGSVYIRSTPQRYLKMASEIDALRKLPSYLAIRQFSDPPQLSDLDGFTLEPEDIKQLKNCKPGHCEIQLPAESMEQFRTEVNWSAADVEDLVNHAAQRMALDALEHYQQGGNAALGAYVDKNHPAAVAETFASLLDRSKALPVYLPELRQFSDLTPEGGLSDASQQNCLQHLMPVQIACIAASIQSDPSRVRAYRAGCLDRVSTERVSETPPCISPAGRNYV